MPGPFLTPTTTLAITMPPKKPLQILGVDLPACMMLSAAPLLSAAQAQDRRTERIPYVAYGPLDGPPRFSPHPTQDSRHKEERQTEDSLAK